MKVRLLHLVNTGARDAAKRWAWRALWAAEVLFADRKVVFLRAAGSHSTGDYSGHVHSVGWRPEHSHVKKANLKRDARMRIAHVGRVRIHPSDRFCAVGFLLRAGPVTDGCPIQV